VRLTPPKFPKRKSATPRAINIYPNICMLICYLKILNFSIFI
jgi:hypothetical protein